MKIAIITACLVAFLVIEAHAAPQPFNFGGMSGFVDTTSVINGETAEGKSESLSKVEETIKAMIHKHLANKKQQKKAKRQQQAKPVPEKASVLPLKQINWDENPEQRALVNEKVPGGTASVDAFLKFLQEQKSKN